jgi:triacylglycerol esterase/lipase EstA (alpha/beta hydrolase family)
VALYNPYEFEFIQLLPDHAPKFASSVRTPLAAFLASYPADLTELVGLNKPSTFDNRAGVVMLEPYDPLKIPVVFVSGSSTNPKDWMAMCSTLRADKVLNKKYQFWFFLYLYNHQEVAYNPISPSGNPFVFSAAVLRASLTEIRETFAARDPRGYLDSMILIGHSMGGVISKLAVQDVGSRIYDTLVKVPLETLVLKDDTQMNTFTSLLLPQPLNFVKRIVFIATPHVCRSVL